MQALSFAVHIPLVCFGIAFPALVLFVEWLYLRTGDELYRTLAKRWTKVMAALFAAGVVTGTILSFEMGLLWPSFTASFGGVFGLGFAIEGFSFFLEAIFIGIYIYGWSRLSPRAHFASGIPVAIAGITGSLTVISVNGWMNHPTGFQLPDGKAFEGLGQTRRGAPVHLLGWYKDGRVEYGIPIPRLLSLLAYHDPNASVAGLDAVPADERPPVNVVRVAFQTMVGIGTLLALLGL